MTNHENDSKVRSIFISDVHLGCRFSKASEALAFLSHSEPENLYLVGDFIDGWALKRRWHWTPEYNALINRIGVLVDQGTKVFYTPGNHDDFLRKSFLDRSSIRIQDQFIHTCADGRNMIVMHGDQFDCVEGHAKWLSVLGSSLYELILTGDRKINRMLESLGLSQRKFSGTIKATTKKIVQYLNGFENLVSQYVQNLGCDGIICGHIHVPKYKMLEEVLYVNLGDWVENSTALVEYDNGKLELLDIGKGRSAARKTILNSLRQATNHNQTQYSQLANAGTKFVDEILSYAYEAANLDFVSLGNIDEVSVQPEPVAV